MSAMLPGEESKGEFDARFAYTRFPHDEVVIKGTIYLTTYKMSFVPEQPPAVNKSNKGEDDEKAAAETPKPLWTINVHSVASIDKVKTPKQKSRSSFSKAVVTAKDMKVVSLLFSNDSKRSAFIYALESVAFVFPKLDKLFAFSSKESFPENGYEIYNVQKEFSRLGINANNKTWRFSKANEEFKLCDTYPRVLVVPAAADDAMLAKVAAFRTRRRLPVLTWISPDGVPMMRSSQPGCGFKNIKSPHDAKYLELIRNCNPVDQTLLFISDSRPKANAVGNRALGGGYEEVSAYPQTRLDFEDIPNIHAVREGYQRVKSICQPGADESDWIKVLDSSRWIDMTRLILRSTLKAIDFIAEKKQAVLFHCSDGWDRTSQCCTLSELCMDPYYRTLNGFEVLLEKDWISFGHRFQLRYAHGDSKPDDQRSPIFPQFIFCVYQLLVQFPFAFEFTPKLLECILENLYSCRFGTFLCNNESERADLQVRKKTVSLWSYVNANKALYLNPGYVASFKDILYPDPSPRVIHLWDEYYLSWMRLLEDTSDPVFKCRLQAQQILAQQQQQGSHKNAPVVVASVDKPKSTDKTTPTATTTTTTTTTTPTKGGDSSVADDTSEKSSSTATGTVGSPRDKRRKKDHHHHSHHHSHHRPDHKSSQS